VVAAAGNYAVDGTESGVRYAPANDPFVITVGAADVGGTVTTADDVAAPWSAYGSTPDGFAKPELGAPGRYLVAAVPPGATLPLQYPERVVEPGYMQLSGTSFAAPVVSGAALALIALHPEWTPDQVKGALMVTAQPTAGGAALGVGEVDAAAAAAVTSPPNPNLALDAYVGPDPAGGPVPVFDAEAWGTDAAPSSTWATEAWGTEAWGTGAVPDSATGDFLPGGYTLGR
ncbi:MAG: serine protease AprX, partial [Gaiellaceae bacterium]|nr:serine protease AprX [Gaiellaceae bacterium]